MGKNHNKSKKSKKNGGNPSSQTTSPLQRYGITSELADQYNRAVEQEFPQAAKIMTMLSYTRPPSQSDKKQISEVATEIDFRKSVIASNLKQIEQYHLSKSSIEKEALLRILNISSLENFNDNDIEAVLNAFTQYSQTADRHYTELRHILKDWEENKEINTTEHFLFTAMQIRFICISFTEKIKDECDKIKKSVNIINERKKKEGKNKDCINYKTLIGQSTIFENPSINIIEQAIHDKYLPPFPKELVSRINLTMTQTFGNFTANLTPESDKYLFDITRMDPEKFVTMILFKVFPAEIPESQKNDSEFLEPTDLLIKLATCIYKVILEQKKQIRNIFKTNEPFNLKDLCTSLVKMELRTDYINFLSVSPDLFYKSKELHHTTSENLYHNLEPIHLQWTKFPPISEKQLDIATTHFKNIPEKITADEKAIIAVLYIIRDWHYRCEGLVNKLSESINLWHELLNGKILNIQESIDFTKSIANFPEYALAFSESTHFIQKNLKCILGPESRFQEITEILTQLSEKPSVPPVIETSPSTSEEPVITPPAQDNGRVSNEESATPVEEHAETMLPQENKAEGKQEEPDDISKDLEIEEEILDPVQIHNQYQLYKLQHKLSSTQTSPPAPNKKILTNQQIAYLQIIEKNGYKDLLLDLFRIDIDSDRKFKMGKLFKLFSDLGGQVVATKGSACRLSLGNKVSGGNHKLLQEIEKSDVATDGFHLKHGKDKNAPVFRYVADIFKNLLIEVGCAPWDLYSNEYNSQEIEQIKDFHLSRLKK